MQLGAAEATDRSERSAGAEGWCFGCVSPFFLFCKKGGQDPPKFYYVNRETNPLFSISAILYISGKMSNQSKANVRRMSDTTQMASLFQAASKKLSSRGKGRWVGRMLPRRFFACVRRCYCFFSSSAARRYPQSISFRTNGSLPLRAEGKPVTQPMILRPFRSTLKVMQQPASLV